MANNYYTFTDTFIPGARARSGDVDREYQAIEAAFDLLPSSNTALTGGRAAFAGTSAGTGNAYEVTMPDTRTANTNGDEVIFIADKTNTGAATLNVDTLGAQAIVRADGNALTAGDIQSGLMYIVRWDSANTRYQMITPSTSYLTDAQAAAAAAAASETAAGLSETAAALSETNAGISETNAAGSAQAAEDWAIYPEDSLVPASSGGNEVDEYSAYHWAQKAQSFSGLPAGTAGQILHYNGAWVATSIITVASGAGTAATFDPGSSQTLYYNNVAHMNTDVYGVNISGRQTGTDGGRLTLQGAPTYNTSYFWQSGNNMLAVMSGQTRWLMSGSGGNTFTDAGGTTSWSLGSTSLTTSGSTGAASISMASTGTATILWGSHSANGGFSFRSASGTFEVWERTNVGGLDNQWIGAANDGGVSLFYAGTSTARTTSNGWEVDGTLIDLDSGAVADAAVRVLTSLGGVRINVDGSTTGQLQIYQTTSAGADEDLWIRGSRNGSTSLYHNGSERIETTTSGINVIGPTGEATIEITGIASNDANLLVQNGNGGYRLNVEASTGNLELWQTTNVGVDEDLWIAATRNGGVSLYYDNATRLLTASTSVDLYGTLANDPNTGGSQTGLYRIMNSGGTLAGDIGYTASVDMLIYNRVHGGDIVFQGEDSGGTVRTMMRLQPGSAGQLLNPTAGWQIQHAGTNLLVTSVNGLAVTPATGNEGRLDLEATGTNQSAVVRARADGGGMAMRWYEPTLVGQIVQTSAGASVEDTWIEMSLNADVALFYDNTEVARTKTAATGGFEVNNTQTGAGFERVLTESDIVAGGDLFKFKDANTARASTTTLADDDDLFGFALEANTFYAIEAWLDFSSSSATPGMRWAFQVSQANQDSAYSYSKELQAGGISGVAVTSVTSIITETMAASDMTAIKIKGMIYTHSTNDPTVDFQWAQNVSSAGNTLLNRGSWIKFTKLG